MAARECWKFACREVMRKELKVEEDVEESFALRN